MTLPSRLEYRSGEDDGEDLALAEEYLRREAEFDDVAATRRVYAKSSDYLITRMKKSWLQ